MAGPVIPQEWSVVEDGETQDAKVEHDRMAPDSPACVTVEVENLHNEHRSYALICLSPTEAREMANALAVYAFFADKENRDA